MDIVSIPLKSQLEAQALIEVVRQMNQQKAGIHYTLSKSGTRASLTDATNIEVYFPGYATQKAYELGRALEREVLRRSLLEPID